MAEVKNIRKKGKFSLNKYFQELKKGDFVSVIREISLNPKFPKRLQGRTGIVESKRGKSYVVKIKDQAKEKKFLIKPIHLKKIKVIK